MRLVRYPRTYSLDHDQTWPRASDHLREPNATRVQQVLDQADQVSDWVHVVLTPPVPLPWQTHQRQYPTFAADLLHRCPWRGFYPEGLARLVALCHRPAWQAGWQVQPAPPAGELTCPAAKLGGATPEQATTTVHAVFAPSPGRRPSPRHPITRDDQSARPLPQHPAPPVDTRLRLAMIAATGPSSGPGYGSAPHGTDGDQPAPGFIDTTARERTSPLQRPGSHPLHPDGIGVRTEP